MKRFLILSLLLGCSFYLMAETPTPLSSLSESSQTHKLFPEHKSCLSFGGVTLYVDSATVISSFELTASRLLTLDAPIGSDMINVTDGVDGFRLLPSGEHFSSPATLAVAYNPARLPIGYMPDDIYTFCFDSAIGHWSRLERVRVDTVSHLVYSLTTHFTDFANFVIRVPEMPESKAFVPTDMQDLPDPDPLTGVPMIAAPVANNMGTAELTYPVTLPPGRHGLQPDLNLHYSSAGGNGLLGVGWSIVQPAVTIDTRWGVPRYDLAYETEAYLINGDPFLLHDAHGEPLPLPHMATSFTPRRAKATRFYARDQRNQSKAVRHGIAPDRYWWSVTTTDGVTYYYGYDPFADELDENSILRTDRGNIGYWALTYVVDRFGNYVHYINDKYNGNEIVIHQIEYTGNEPQNLAPTYRIRFFYKWRGDRLTDARLGLLRKQEHLLCHFDIGFLTGAIPFTSYRLYYESGSQSLYKSRLTSVAKVDGGIQYEAECMAPLNQAPFHLSNEQWIADEDTMYSHITHEGVTPELKPASVTHFKYANAYESNELFQYPQTLINGPVNFSSSRSEGWNLGGTVTIGVGYNPAMTTFSAGANYSYNRTKGAVETMMIDLNGDGLLDRLSVSGDHVLYQRQNADATFANAISIQGLDRLSREVSSSHNFGAQLDFVANLSYSPTISDSYTDIYFSDINNDNLPDLITPEGVHLNSLNSSHIPTFTPISDDVYGLEVHGNNCSKAITFSGEVDERLMCHIDYVCVDTLYVADIGPSDDGESEFVEHPMTPDEPEHEEWGKMEPTDWHPLPLDDNAKNVAPLSSIRDTLHDKELLPKMESKNLVLASASSGKSNSGDNWTDILHHYYEGDDYSFRLNGDSIFVYHREFVCDTTSDEPNVDIVRVWTPNGIMNQVTIKSVAALLQDTSMARVQSRYADGVRLRIQHCHYSIPIPFFPPHTHTPPPLQLTESVIYDKVLQADNYTADSITLTRPISPSDVFFFRLSARNNRRFDDVRWEQTICSTSGDTLYNSSRDYICTGDQHFVAPRAGTTRVSLSCKNDATQAVQVVAKHQSATLLSFTLSANTSIDTTLICSVQDSDHISFFVDTLFREPQWCKVRVVPKVDYWGAFVSDSLHPNQPDTLHYYPDVHLQHSVALFAPIAHPGLFGPLHKGWGWFAYNDINHDAIIPISSLRNEERIAADSAHAHQSTYYTDNTYIDLRDSTLSDSAKMAWADSRFSAVPIYDPLGSDKRWVAMHADYAHNRYVAYGNTGSIGQYTQSTSRQLDAIADTTIIKEEITEYDSPIPTLHGGMQRVTTIRKSTHSVQHGLSCGISTPVGIGFSENASFGTYDVTSDYMDLNGDGFPDFIGAGAVQYTMPWGGIGSILRSLPNSFKSENRSGGLAFSASRPIQQHAPGNSVRNGKMTFGGMGGGLNGQVGTDDTQYSFVDINADGLPDIVDAVHQRFRYNLGYSFTDWHSLSSLSIASSEHADASISLSGNAFFEQIWDVTEIAKDKIDYSWSQYSISGGISTSASANSANVRLMDVNGDGYPDLVFDYGSDNLKVRYFNGTSFSNIENLNVQNLQTSSTANLGFNLSVTAGFDLVLIPVKFCFGVQSSPWNVSSTYSYSDFMDVNGDGFVDQLLTDDNGLRVRYNRNGLQPINLLTSVTNPTEQTLHIDYSLSAPSVNHRMRTWEMTSVDDNIPTVLDDTYRHTMKYAYSNPFYDNFEKTDYGYNQVETNDENTKYTIENYENSHYINHGEKYTDLLLNEHHAPLIGHSHEMGYHDSLDVMHSDICNDIYLHIGEEGYWTYYFDTDPSPSIVTRYEKTYDKHHNLIEYIDHGDINIADDDWRQTIYYKPTTSFNMISLPIEERVRDSFGNIVRLRRAKYNTYGQPHQIIDDDLNQHISAVTALSYDLYGNISRLRSPMNENHEWFWRYFEYDPQTQTHVARVLNCFGEQHLYNYDLRFGLRSRSIDPAGNEMQWRYDRMGRLIDILAPNERHLGRPFSVHYIYRQPYHDVSSGAILTYKYPHITKVAATNQLASVDVSIYDARGMALQRKSWRLVNGHEEWVTDGWRNKDKWYRPTQTYDPFVTDIMHDSLWDTDIAHYAPYPTDYHYDALGRTTDIRHPDASYITYDYNFATDIQGHTRLRTRWTDENGILHQQLRSPQDWTIETWNLTDNSVTHYNYNSVGELMRVRDADGYITTYDYNMFGQRITRYHPDAGITRWRYAPDGSLISVQTSRLAPTNDSIHYNYCFGRLMDITYPYSPLNNVHYQYDIAGRMAYYEDGTGSTRLYYDPLGNVRTTLRRVIIPTEQYVYTYRTESIYDSFGRIHGLVYPDGDKVDYTYYRTGELQKVTRSPLLGPSHAPIVMDMDYDCMGHNIYRRYGNGVCSSFAYEPQRNWLERKRTISTPCTLQDLTYTYDGVGNITRIDQNAPAYNALGGDYRHDYVYDAQYRLVQAQSPFGAYSYNFNTNYSPAGRLGHNYCSNTSGVADVNSLYGYDLNKFTHQPRVVFDYNSHVRMNLYWDANGNLSQMQNCEGQSSRFHDWDEENRLRMVIGKEYAGYYGYDANGERVYKLIGKSMLTYSGDDVVDASINLNDAVLYPNPYVTITPTGYTKHYYANSERLATVIGKGGWCSMVQEPISPYQTGHDWYVDKWWYEQYTHNYPLEYPQEHLPISCENEKIGGTSIDVIQYDCPPRHVRTLSLSVYPRMLYFTMQDGCVPQVKEQETYYTHSDHLGSASWITNELAKPVQYLHYLPYGQLLAKQQAIGSTYDERYNFTGKERDYETGYDYFGARYYSPLLMHFTSVEPLLDKYLHISPYSYAAWNPIKYVDSDGRKIVVGSWLGRALSKLGFNNFENKTQQRLQYLKTVSPELNNAITSMETNNDVIVKIYPMSQYKEDANKGVTIKENMNSNIYYNEDAGFLIDGNYSSPDAILAHELGHAENNMNGTSISYKPQEAKKTNGDVTEKRKGNANERKSITYENQVRQKEGEPARSYDYYKANKEE